MTPSSFGMGFWDGVPVDRLASLRYGSSLFAAPAKVAKQRLGAFSSSRRTSPTRHGLSQRSITTFGMGFRDGVCSVCFRGQAAFGRFFSPQDLAKRPPSLHSGIASLRGGEPLGSDGCQHGMCLCHGRPGRRGAVSSTGEGGQAALGFFSVCKVSYLQNT